MTYKNYLVRLNTSLGPTFLLARGHELECPIEGLAIVRISDMSDSCKFSGDYSIIDIATGLFVVRAKSKKKLLEKWNQKLDHYPNFALTINNARNTDKYPQRVAEASEEKRIWRECGYKIEGR